MTTFIRLLRVVRRLHVSSKTRINGGNSLKDAEFQRLLHSQTLLLSNQKSEFATVSKAQEKTEDSDDRNMIKLFQLEIQNYGVLRKVDVDKLLEDVKESGVVSSLQGLFLLRCCSEWMMNKSRLSRQLLGQEIWKTLKELGVLLDVSHYNALLHVYKETDYQFSPVDFLEDMVNAGVKPNRVTFQKLIAQCCQEGQMSEANQILDQAKNQGIPVNEDMLSSLVHGHFNNHNDEAAFEIVKEMEHLGIPFTIKTYSTLMYVYACRGEIDNIKNTLKECEAKDIFVPDKVFLWIIHDLSIHGFSQHIDEILSLTSRNNVRLSTAIKIINTLVEKHHYEIAFKIYQILVADNRRIVGGSIFLQALINSNAPLEKTIQYCKLMEVENLNPKAFLSAFQKTIANHMYHTSIRLLEAWKDLGGVIKPGDFIPLMKAYEGAGQYEEMVCVMQKMISEFQLQPTVHMLVNYILPYMQCQDDEMLLELLGRNVFHIRAANAVVLHFLKRNKIRKVVEIMRHFPMQYRGEIIQPSLIDVFKNTEDVPSFVSIVHHLYMLKLISGNSNVVDDTMKDNARSFVDSLITDTIDALLSKNEPDRTSTTHNMYLIDSIYQLFRNLIDRGINLSPAVADDIKAKLGNEVTQQIEKSLSILKSEDLVPKSITNQIRTMCLQKKLTTVEKLEKLVELRSENNLKNALYYKKMLLNFYCALLNYEKIYEVFQDLQKNRYEFSSATHASVIDALLRMNKIDEAVDFLMSTRGVKEDFNISKILLLKLATALVEQGHFEGALDCLKQQTFPSNNRLLKSCTKFLTAILKFDDENYLLQAFDVLKENGYIIELENHLFTPLILLYLNRGDNKAALEKFEWVHTVYGLAPCQIQLMKEFIKNDDKVSLNRIKNVCIRTDGVANFYINLALANLENGQFLEAKKIIQNHVPCIPETVVFEQATLYCNNRQTDNLENLFQILNELNYDVENLCIVLLKAFGYYNELEKGYKLWMKMQKDNIKPSYMFYDYLNLIMSQTTNKNSVLQEFFAVTDGSDDLKERELLEKLPLLYKSDGYSRLCKKACFVGNFSDAIELYKDLRNRFGLDIHSSDAAVILNSMLKSKDVDCIEKMGMYMSQDLKKHVKYRYYLNHAYLISGSWNLYLKDIEKRLDEGSINWLNLNMDFKTTVESLFQHPELLEQHESVARKCIERNIDPPMQALWIYYFFNNQTKANKLWLEFIKNSMTPLWVEVKNYEQTSPEMYIRIAEHLKDSAVKLSRKSQVFTSLINRALHSDHPKRFEIALQCLIHGTEKLPMESYDIDLLAEVEKGLENSGIKWPWSKRMNKQNEKHQVEMVVDAILKLQKSSH